MDTSLNFREDAESWETLMFLYNSALKEVTTKISSELVAAFIWKMHCSLIKK